MMSSPVDHSSQQENTTNLVPIYPAFIDIVIGTVFVVNAVVNAVIKDDAL